MVRQRLKIPVNFPSTYSRQNVVLQLNHLQLILHIWLLESPKTSERIAQRPRTLFALLIIINISPIRLKLVLDTRAYIPLLAAAFTLLLALIRIYDKCRKRNMKGIAEAQQGDGRKRRLHSYPAIQACITRSTHSLHNLLVGNILIRLHPFIQEAVVIKVPHISTIFKRWIKSVLSIKIQIIYVTYVKFP